MTLAAAHVLYVLVVILAAVAAHLTPALDLRGVGRARRAAPTVDAHEVDFDDEGVARELADLRAEAARARRLQVIPRADLLFLSVAGGVVGLSVWALAGFLGPRLISEAFGAQPLNAPVGAWTSEGQSIMERGAQAIGAVAAVTIGLRVYQVTLALAAVSAACAVAVGAAYFALGRPLPTL